MLIYINNTFILSLDTYIKQILYFIYILPGDNYIFAGVYNL